MLRWTIVAVLVSASCASETETEAEHSERFRGRWIVDQPFHAGYEATVYELDALGRVRVLDACDWSELDSDYVTGTVENEAGVRCEFGASWQSNGPDQLIISGVCDDGRNRDIALGFDSDASRNTEGIDVVVDSVAGEPGWAHRDFAWQWTRCPETGCEPVWVCP